MPSRLEGLLARWEQQRRNGKRVSVDDLCRDCPEMRAELLAQVNALEKMDHVLHLTEKGQPAAKAERRRTRYDDLRPAWEPVVGYRLEKRLGKGGFGEVWKAIGPGGFAVALKFVSLTSQVGASEVHSLDLIKTIRHPSLLSVFGTWQVHGFLVIAMELADRTLMDRLHEATMHGEVGIPPAELLRYMQEAAKGIDYLNMPNASLGDSRKEAIQHRDIKPQNILLMGGGIKIGDFGLLKILKTTVTEHTGSLTPSYAAPEFFMGHTSHYSDQYSLAVTYCHLRGGRLPFTGNPGQIMDGHLKGTPDLTMLPAVERGPVMCALQKDPTRRWPTCTDFVSALTDRAAVASSPPVAMVAADPRLNMPTQLLAKPVRASAMPQTPPEHATLPPTVLAPRAHQSKGAGTPLGCGIGAVVGSVVLLAAAVIGLLWLLAQPDADAPKDNSKQVLEKKVNEKNIQAKDVVVIDKEKGGPINDLELPALPLDKNIKDTQGPAVAGEDDLIREMKFVPVKRGTFWMGGGSVEGPPTKQVTIDNDFEMAAYTVTQGQWEAVMGVGSNPSYFSRQGKGRASVADVSIADLTRFPVEMVSWDDAQKFLEKLNEQEQGKGWKYRLPREAEWEFACRGGAGTSKEECAFDFYFAKGTNDLSWDQANFNGEFPAGNGAEGKSLGRTTQVGQYQRNKLGLYDMHGNVWQWCVDLYDDKGSARVMRGGCWDYRAWFCRSASRDRGAPYSRSYYLGFRVARVPYGSGKGPEVAIMDDLIREMKFMRAKEGTFWIGGGSVEGPPRKQVAIGSDFELAAYTVTQGQWEAVMGIGNNPSWFVLVYRDFGFVASF